MTMESIGGDLTAPLRDYIREAMNRPSLAGVALVGTLSMTGCGERTEGVHCVTVTKAEECLSVETAEDELVGRTTCSDPVLEVVGVNDFISREPYYDYYDYYYGETGDPQPSDEYDRCCYEVTYKSRPGEACVIGRPLMEGEEQVTARAALGRDGGWGADSKPLSGAELPSLERAAVANHWSRAALGEHASVASFAHFAMDLLAHGAPPHLLKAALDAGADEVEHARACFALASRYHGTDLSPGPLPTNPRPPATLEEMVRALIQEGCVGETLAVMQAVEQLKRSTDEDVRKTLTRIIEDEQRHAELAWATLEWALSIGGPELHAVAVDEFSRAEEMIPRGGSERKGSAALLEAHGCVDQSEIAEALERGLEAVIKPMARTLLAGQTAEA